MENTLIAIPTRGRTSYLSRSTLRYIPRAYWENTRLFVKPEEQVQYQRSLFNCQFDVQTVAFEYENISVKRKLMAEWARDQGYKKILMLDDDLIQFSTRIDPMETSLRKSTPQDIVEMFETVVQYLEWYAHVGVSARFGNNAFVGEKPVVVENTRMLRTLCYQIEPYLLCEHGRISTTADIEVTIQLLRMGYKNCVLYNWAQDQEATNSPGGCSLYRTLEVNNQNKERLKELHPEFVRLVHKRNTGESAVRAGLSERLEVVVSWEKAYASSQVAAA